MVNFLKQLIVRGIFLWFLEQSLESLLTFSSFLYYLSLPFVGPEQSDRGTVIFMITFGLSSLIATFSVLMVEKSKIKTSPVIFALVLFLIRYAPTAPKSLSSIVEYTEMVEYYTSFLLVKLGGAVLGGLAATKIKKEIKLSLVSNKSKN